MGELGPLLKSAISFSNAVLVLRGSESLEEAHLRRYRRGNSLDETTIPAGTRDDMGCSQTKRH
jgi:hypothetical protein